MVESSREEIRLWPNHFRGSSAEITCSQRSRKSGTRTMGNNVLNHSSEILEIHFRGNTVLGLSRHPNARKCEEHFRGSFPSCKRHSSEMRGTFSRNAPDSSEIAFGKGNGVTSFSEQSRIMVSSKGWAFFLCPAKSRQNNLNNNKNLT